MSLIQAITLLHESPKKGRKKDLKIDCIELTQNNIALAKKFAHKVLGGSINNIPTQTIILLLLIEEMVNKECLIKRIDRVDFEFSGKQVRTYTGWHRISHHLHLLKKSKHLIVNTSLRRKPVTYKLRVENRRIRHFVMGQTDS